MWFSLFMLLFLLAATYFQAIQGTTSAIIMGVTTALSAGIAFGTYEYVAETALMGVVPEFAHPIAFMGMFLVPLIVLRLMLDSLISRANMLPHLLDRAVAGVIGFFTAFLITGMLAIGLQMVPWPSVIGFSRFDHANPKDQNELWLRMDRAAASYGAMLSAGVFGGEQPLSSDHPDLVSELGWLQAGVRGVRRTAPVDALTFQAASEIPQIFDVRGSNVSGRTLSYDPVDPAAGHRFLRVTVKVGGDPDKLGDSDQQRRFVPAAIRLVGANNEAPEIYPGIAVPDDVNPNNFVRTWEMGGIAADKRYTAGQTLPLPASGVVEVVFEVPKTFVPRTIKYKLGAQTAFGSMSSEPAPPPDQPAPTPTPTPTIGGRTSGVKVIFGKSHFGADLPVTLTAYQGATDVQNGSLVEGSVRGNAAEQGAVRRDAEVARFQVPEGKALLHLNVESLRAGSLAGQVLNFAAQTVENYIVEDDRGNQLTPVGKYATAKIGDDEIFELQYYPQPGGRVKPFELIKSAHLKKDYQLVYLYLLDSGAKAMKFSPGGNLRTIELDGENLVAP